jgi:tripeptide aminopeptidase
VSAVHPVSEGERRRLHATFESLCRIPSPTGDERAVADWLTRELGEMGLEVEEDGAGATVGANAGNLLVRIPGDGRGSGKRDAGGRRRNGGARRGVLLCAHMDTVPLTAPVEPVLVNDGWENANDGILGADNKSAVAALVELARRLTSREAGAAWNLGVDVELLFTVSEETGLQGAKAFDVSRLRSDFGYVFDHASPLGEIIFAAPTHMRIAAEVRGRAAHAGLEPELGVNAIAAAARAITAMPQGRLDPETTANVGTVSGGTATNVVAERCRVTAEVRGIDQDRVDAVLTEAIDALHDAVDQSDCDLDLSVERMFSGYRLRATEQSIVVAQRALSAIGYVPRPISTGGGADANAFRAAGFPCTNLANGTEYAHQPCERVSSVALEAGLELVVALLDAAGDLDNAGRRQGKDRGGDEGG